jgi:hypothetical protein
MFKLSPLPIMSWEQAEQSQFRIVECLAELFTGTEMLSAGDYGVTPQEGGPIRTRKIEKALAMYFGTEDCVLVRGSGTGGIRSTLSSCLNPGDPVMLHQAPMFATTKETVRMMGLEPIFVDYHDREAVLSHLSQVNAVYIQHSRQQVRDDYDVHALIQLVKQANPAMIVIVDDNYTVFKVPKIGVELGADLSTFSSFKVLGPEGVGVVAGRKQWIDIIRHRNYSGGSQVQGPEAMEMIRAFIQAPMAFAVQNEQVVEIVRRMNAGEIPEIESATLSSAQSLNVTAKLVDPVAGLVVEHCEQFGAANYPVGSESKYEILPMVYRVSGAFGESNPELWEYLLRINPMRGSADLVMNIMKKTMKQIKKDK